MGQTLQQYLNQRDNDYSQLEAVYFGQSGAPLVNDPYASILHPLDDITLSASIIIPAWNAANSIEQVLKAIEQSSFNQKYPDQLEVIVVDDGSQDETWQILERLDLNIHLKAIHQENHGRSQARNTAITMSEADVIICCDADMILSTFAIEELMKRHQICDQVLLLGFRTPVPPDYAAFEPANLCGSLKNMYAMFYGDSRINYFIGGWGLCRETAHLKQLGRGNAICRPSGLWHNLPLQVYGCLFSLRRHDLLAMNGYDEGFYGWGYEDLMVGAYAIALGNYVIPVYAAAGWHIRHEDRGPSLTSFSETSNYKRWSEYARNQVYYRQRLHKPLPTRNFSWEKQARERVLKSFERHPSRRSIRGEIDSSYYDCYRNITQNLHAFGRYYFQVGRYQEAAQIFSEIRGTEREERAAMLIRGKSLRLAGCTDEAVTSFKESLSSYRYSFCKEDTSIYINALVDFALALAAQGRFAEARLQIHRADEVQLDNPMLRALFKKPYHFYEEQAHIYLRQRDYTHALQACEIALLLEPHDLLMQAQRVHILACIGKQDESQKAQKLAIVDVPLDVGSESYASISQAWEHLVSGHMERAKIAFEQLLRVHPDNAYLLHNLHALHSAIARLRKLPLVNRIFQETQAIPGAFTSEELAFLISLTMQIMGTLHDEEPGLFIDADSYCGQAIVAIGLVLRGIGCNERRLVSIYQPRQEPVEFAPMVLPTSRELCWQFLWQYELTEHVLCIPEQGLLPQEQIGRLLLVTETGGKTGLPIDIAEYLARLAPGGFVLAHPYHHEHQAIQLWVDGLLIDSHYTLLGQVGRLIALQAPASPVA